MKTPIDRLKANGVRIRDRRIHLGWDQEQLAQNCKLAPRTIQRAEAGENISPDTAAQISAALGVTRGQILDDQAIGEPGEAPNRVVLRPAQSAHEVVDLLLRTDIHKLECEVDPAPETAEPLIAIAEEFEKLESPRREGTGLEMHPPPDRLTFSSRVKVTARVAALMTKLESHSISVFCGEYVALTSRDAYAEEIGVYEKYDHVAVVVISSGSAAKVSRVVYDKRSDEGSGFG